MLGSAGDLMPHPAALPASPVTQDLVLEFTFAHIMPSLYPVMFAFVQFSTHISFIYLSFSIEQLCSSTLCWWC